MAKKKDRKQAGPMRLDKFLAEMGKGTRSEVREMARRGRILVNGETEKKPERKIDPESDTVTLDGERVGYAAMEYYLLNKPQGVVSATEDGRYRTVVELITGAARKDLFPVGRLDIDTEGLLLITNDGDLAHRLLSPKKHVDKVYYAEVSGTLPDDAKERFDRGIVLEDGTKTLPAVFEAEGPAKRDGACLTAVRLTIREGKFHQVKRMFEALGCRVEYLRRLSMGPLKLDPALALGEYRPLTRAEIEQLRGESDGSREESSDL